MFRWLCCLVLILLGLVDSIRTSRIVVVNHNMTGRHTEIHTERQNSWAVKLRNTLYMSLAVNTAHLLEYRTAKSNFERHDMCLIPVLGRPPVCLLYNYHRAYYVYDTVT